MKRKKKKKKRETEPEGGKGCHYNCLGRLACLRVSAGLGLLQAATSFGPAGL